MESDRQDISNIAQLGQMFAEHGPQLLAMVRRRMPRVVASRLDAEDILNEAFLRAQSRLTQFQQNDEVTAYAWLYRLCRDQLIDSWRRESRERRDVRREMPWPEHSSIQLGMRLIHTGTSPSAAVGRIESRQRVREVMALLKDRDQEVLAMRHFDHLSFKDIAAVLGISTSAATVRYARAMRRLKVLWEGLSTGASGDPLP